MHQNDICSEARLKHRFVADFGLMRNTDKDKWRHAGHYASYIFLVGKERMCVV